MNVFLDLALLIAVTTIVSFLMKLLRQPLIVGYILTGVLAGPYLFNHIHTKEYIELFSKIGITILLFIVGLNMSPKVIKEVGRVAVLIGAFQVAVTAILGFAVATLLQMPFIVAVYAAIALTFSSTIIILKLLSDKSDLNKLYAKVSVGFLLVQDIIAAVILIAVPSFGGNAEQVSLISSTALLMAKALSVGIVLYMITAYLFPRLNYFMAASQELLFLFSIAWGLSLSSVFYVFGFSAEIGALIAGITLSVTPFAYEIGSRLKPLRDFFVVLFFILVGSQLEMGRIPSILLPAVVLSLFVLIGKPVIIMVLMNLLGFKRRTGYLTGLTSAQISEFSLILAALGASLGHLSGEFMSLMALVGLLTIGGSTYLILYSETIYPHVQNVLRFLEIRKNNKELVAEDIVYDIVLFGFDRVGHDFVSIFQRLEKNYLVVDFNPDLIKIMEEAGIPFKYGDAEDVEFLHELNLNKIQMCVSTIPDVKVSILLLKRIRRVNPHAIVILLTHDIKAAKELYDAGATYVVMPHYLGAKYASGLISRLGFDKKLFEEEKSKHIQHIEKRTS